MSQSERLDEIEKILNNIVIESSDSDDCLIIKNTDSVDTESIDVKDDILPSPPCVKDENVSESIGVKDGQEPSPLCVKDDSSPIINPSTETFSSNVPATETSSTETSSQQIIKQDEVKTVEDDTARIERLENMVKNLDTVTQQLVKENNELKSFKEYHETSYIHYFYSKLTGLWS